MERQHAEEEDSGSLAHYPALTRLTSSLIGVYMLVVGFIGLYQIRIGNVPVLSWAFLIWSLLSVLYLLPRRACKNCVNYGKACHVGWGKLAAVLFSKGQERDFARSLTYPRFFLRSFFAVPPLVMLGFLVAQLAAGQSLSVLTMVMLVNYVVLIRLLMLYNAQTGCLVCGMRDKCPGGRWAERNIRPSAKSKVRSKHLATEQSHGQA